MVQLEKIRIIKKYMKTLKPVFLYYSILLSTICYSQDSVKGDYLVGKLDNDEVNDTLSFYKLNDVIKCELKSSSKININFEIEATELNFGFDNPGKGIISFINSGVGQTRLEETQFYVFEPSIKNWILTKNISLSSNIDEKGGLTIPYIEFEYSCEKSICESIDGKSIIYEISKPKIEVIDQLLSDVKSKRNVKYDLIEYLFNYPISNKNVVKYNDLAYFLSNDDISLYILSSVIKKFPKRTVAYLNIGDSFYNLGNEYQARKNYKKYISLMKLQKKDLKIPKYVYERLLMN